MATGARAWAGEVARINRIEETRWVALRAGLTVLVMLTCLAAAGRPEWAVYAIFGGFVNIHGPGRAVPGRWRIQALVAVVQTTAVGIGALVGLSPQRDRLSVLVVPLVAVAAHLVYDRWRILPHAPLFPILATAAIGAKTMTASDIAPAVLVTGGVAVFAVAFGRVSAIVHRRPLGAPLDATVVPVSRQIVHDAVLAGVAVALSGVLALLTGVGHVFWAMFSAGVVMSMGRRRSRAVRALNRMAGTMAGVLVAWPLLALPIPVWVLVGLAAVLQGAATMLVPRQYALAMVAITPLALMVNQWAAPQPVEALLQARVVETVLGAAVALVVVVVDLQVSRRRP